MITSVSLDATQIQAAISEIDTFEQSSAAGVWACLEKATIVAELRSRIADPFQVNQGGQPFCGPACVLFELVRKQPIRYVQICRNLFESGGFQGTTQWIRASEALRGNVDRNLRMSQTDWMVLATLRESESSLFPIEPNASELIRNLAGMTKSWEIKGWIRELLGYSKTDYHQAFLFSDIEAMNQSIAAIQAGGVALLLVTAEGLLQGNPLPIPFPSHWVTLLGNFRVNGEQVSFDVYTWAKQVTLQTDMSSFKKYFWAGVTGMP
ncbi:hypothetical protein [Leptolyngbya sp. NIES-2104]|uniref:hypothetical protein n=1 Tax=Leptolyngbya sp. NIES-2104 TaxID=1552121 RepID=UPI0006ECABB3|nr:hypothetical protein [Leptolyngbya sp. NIES-2104]GAP95859.1 hypothetical protein NIES2104_23850 [Leptolyngbya sp. NIES-2104]